MELEAVRVAAPTERLLLAGLRAREMGRVARQLVCVRVPLEYRQPFADDAEHGIAAARRADREVVPTDLGLLLPRHRRAEHVGQQLCAQADAEHGLALLESALDRDELGLQMRSPMLILDVHRAAEHDEAAIAVDGGLRVRVPLEV